MGATEKKGGLRYVAFEHLGVCVHRLEGQVLVRCVWEVCLLFRIWCYKANRHHFMCCKGPLQHWTVMTVLGHVQVCKRIECVFHQLPMHKVRWYIFQCLFDETYLFFGKKHNSGHWYLV